MVNRKKKAAGKIANGEHAEIEKSDIHIVVELIEYVPRATLSRTILKKSTGNVTAMALAQGEELGAKMTPFDTYVQIIDGTAHLTIGRKTFQLVLGNGIVIPAHKPHSFTARQKFKMISTVIKEGYESLTPGLLP